jgi:tetratricopeptide (TPR) repeat protein
VRAALREWAAAEEEYGDLEAAIAVCRRWLEIADEAERPAVGLRTARMLEERGRPTEAIASLAPALAAMPPLSAALEMGRHLLAKPKVAEELERVASRAERGVAARLLEFLVDAREPTLSMPAARRRWLLRSVESPSGGRPDRLAPVLEGALDFPDEIELWQAAERMSRGAGKLDLVVRAYHRVLLGNSIETGLAEVLGRRMLALEPESSVEASFFVEVLRRVLEGTPAARWALDRVKLTLGSQGRWDELFRFYDRAIHAAREQDRLELLDEAAFAARDLAGDPDRATAYLKTLHAFRPEDEATVAALERLYERSGRKIELSELLAERADLSGAGARREVQRRLAALWLELGDAAKSSGVVEAMLDEGAPVADLIDLLESVARHAEGTRAIARLRAHYLGSCQFDEAMRISRVALDRAANSRERVTSVREIVRVCLLAAAADGAADSTFVRAVDSLEQDAARDPRIGKLVLRALLVRANVVCRRAETDRELDDAAEGAYRAVRALAGIFRGGGDDRRASLVLDRGAHLRLDRRRRRALLHEAVLSCPDGSDHKRHALRMLGELFEGDDTDQMTVGLLPRFASLLEEAGQHGRLARVWETQARRRAGASGEDGESECFLRAAAAWERNGSSDRAVAAFGHAAALGSRAAYDALAHIHAAKAEWTDALRALEWLRDHSVPPARDAYLLRLAEGYLATDARSRARSCLESVHDSASGHSAVARAGLLAIYRADGVWEPLARLLIEDAAGQDDARKKGALLREAASVLRSKLHRSDEATATLEQAVAADPEDSALCLELCDILEGAGQSSRVARILERFVELRRDQPSRERAVVLHRLARALIQSGDSTAALPHLRVAARLQPSHPAVLYDLGRVALSTQDLDLAASTYRTLLLVLRRSMDRPEGVSRTQVILDLCQITLRKGDETRAATLLESALEDAWNDGEDPRPFERALRDMGQYRVVARSVERGIDAARSPAEVAAALGDLATLWREHLDQDPELEKRLRRVAETLAPDLDRNVTPGSDAWIGLWSLRRHLGDDAARLEMVRRCSGMLSAGGEGNAFGSSRWLEDAASLCERAGERELGAAVLGALVARDPRNQDACAKLAATLHDLDRVDEAARLFESLLDRRPADVGTVRALAERLEALGSPRLADCLEWWMSLDEGAARTLAPRLVSLREASGDRGGLIRAVRRRLDADPDDRALLQRLVGMYKETGAIGKALRLLDGAIDRAAGDPDLLCLRAVVREHAGDDEGAASDVLRIGRASAHGMESVIDLLRRIVDRGRTSTVDDCAIALVDILRRANRLEQAEEQLDRLLQRSPFHQGALERLAALSAAKGAWDRAAGAYERLLPVIVGSDATVDSERLSRIALAMADAHARAGHAGAARNSLEGVLRRLPDSVELAKRLERVCEVTGDHERLSELLAVRAERSRDVGEKSALFLRAAGLVIQDGRGAARAVPLIERARSVEPQSLEAALAWARARRDLGRPGDALAALEDVVARNGSKRDPRLGEVHLEIAKLYLAQDDLAEAFDALKAGFAIQGHPSELGVLLGLVAIDLGDDKTAERALMAVALAAPAKSHSSAGSSPTDRITAFYHLALMACGRGEEAKARRWVAQALTLDPMHVGAVGLSERLAAQTPSVPPLQPAVGASTPAIAHQ